jgi:thioredoxin 1
MIMSHVLHSSTANFDRDVLQSPVPVLVDLYADWCGPCRALAPLLNKLSGEFAGRVRIIKIDIDADSAIAARYQVDSIPTLLFFSKGQLVHRTAGLLPEASLRSILTKLESQSGMAKQAG